MINRKLHIVYVCAEFPLEARPTGGYGRYVDTISQSLARRGHQVTVICRGSKNGIVTNKTRQVIVLNCKEISFINFLKKFSNEYIKRLTNYLEYPLIFSLQARKQINYLLKSQTVDLIEGSEFAGEMFFTCLLKTNNYPTTAIKLHTPSFIIRKFNQERKTLFFLVTEILEVVSLKFVDRIYAPSKFISDLVYKKVGRKAEICIPNPMCIPTKNWHMKKNYWILYAGKYQTKKGIFLLADVAKDIIQKFPKVMFIFAGPDTMENGESVKKKLETILQSKNIFRNFKLYYQLSLYELSKLYKKSLITVVPSLWDSSSYTVLEAASYHSAVIASSVGGIQDILDDSIGIPFTLSNRLDFKNKLHKLLNDSAYRQRVVNRSVNAVKEKYDATLVGIITEKFYYKISNNDG